MEIKTKKILVVEDEKSLSTILQKALHNAGFETTAAFDGEEALKVLADNKFDLVLLDIMLPKVSGIDVLAEMSKRHDLTPVIAVTNLGQEESKKEAMDLGAKNYLVKSETPIAEIVRQVKSFN
ncbi:MAG TPA: response regulator [Candidatus Limnocylindria bacterium]|nr:response regulator [Candidatus Limnocylindria bacterium]